MAPYWPPEDLSELLLLIQTVVVVVGFVAAFFGVRHIIRTREVTVHSRGPIHVHPARPFDDVAARQGPFTEDPELVEEDDSPPPDIDQAP